MNISTYCMLMTLSIVGTAQGFFFGSYDYDLLVIGNGTAGLTTALLAREEFKDKKIAVIGQGGFGGGAFKWADIPSGILNSLANDLHTLEAPCAGDIFDVSSAVIDCNSVFSFIEEKSILWSRVYNAEFCHGRDIEYIRGYGRFIDGHTVSIDNGRCVTAKNIMIATGSRPKIEGLKGIEQVAYLTPESFFQESELPESLVIVGGGMLGVQFADACNKLHVDVTLLMRHDRLLPQFDAEIVALLTEEFAKQGIKIFCGVTACEVAQTANGVTVFGSDERGNPHQFDAQKLFVAMGRTANIDDLGLEKVNLALKNGDILVDDKMQTSVQNIYAAGDVVYGYAHLSSLASHQAYLAVLNMFTSFWDPSKKRWFSDAPKVLLTTPTAVSYGMTEQEARARYGDQIKVIYQSYKDVLKSYIDVDAENGLVKLICDNQDKLIGVHIVGKRADAIVDVIELHKTLGEQFGDYLLQMYTFPSYYEMLWLAAKKH